MSEKKILEVNWIPAVGSALGAVTSAVVLSTLGVAGTLIGAALGSLLITVAGSVYSRSIERTKKRLSSRVVDTRSKNGQRNDAAAQDERSVHGRADDKWRSLPWKRILGLAGILFVVTMAVILAFELATGRTVSSYTGGSSATTGGTSIPGISGFRDTGTGTTPEEQQQQQNQVPTDAPPLPGDQATVPADNVPAAPDAPQQQVPEPDQQQGGQEQVPAPGGQEQAPAQ